MKILKFGERVKKTDANPYGWETLYTFHKGKLKDTSLKGHKSVIFLSGGGTIEDDDMNGCAKAAELMLKKAGLKKLPHLYTVGFELEVKEHRKNLLTQMNMARFGIEGTEPRPDSEFPDYWTGFFNEYLLPLFCDDQGNAHPIDESIKNLQNITFLTHCHGGMYALQLENVLIDKLKELYPESYQQVVKNIRMIHLASRRPRLKESHGTHFHLFSQSDNFFADTELLEYDSLVMNIHRNKIKDSLLMKLNDNEDMLILNQLTTAETFNGNNDDHRKFISIFSQKIKEPRLPQNNDAILLTQALLRHFVEKPQDNRPIREILSELNPQYVQQAQQQEESYLALLQEKENLNRSLLSLVSLYQISHQNLSKDILLERNDEGRFLYDELKEQYQKTGQTKAFIPILKKIKHHLPQSEKIALLKLVVSKNDWQLMNLFIEKQKNSNTNPHFADKAISKNFLTLSPMELKEIITGLQDKDLGKIRPLIKITTLEQDPTLIDELLKKSQNIPNPQARLDLECDLQDVKDKALTTPKGRIMSCLYDCIIR